MLLRVADWHGVQAAQCYVRWMNNGDDNDLRNYTRHASIADRMWKALARVQHK